MTLKSRVVSGLSWSATGRGARELIQLVCLLVIARFLEPVDMGIYAIVLVFINLMTIIGSAGSSQILIMREEAGPRLVVSLFYLNLMIGALSYLLLYALSGFIANFFSAPELELLLDLAALAFLIQAPVLVQRALMEKALKFKRLVAAEMLSVFLSAALGIGCAVAGLGVYSLLVLNLSGLSLLAVFLWFISDWRPRGQPDRAELVSVAREAFHLTAFSLVNFLTRNVDVFLIGRVIGGTQLGFYTMAYRLSLYPVQTASQIVHRVAFPALSRLRGEPELGRGFYLQSLQGVSLIMFPVLAGMGAVANTFVPLVLGASWLDSIALIHILVPVGMLQVVTATVGTIYAAQAQTGLMLRMGVLNSVVVVLAFVAGIRYGTQGVALAYLMANLLMFYPNLRVSWKLLGLPLRRGLGYLVAPMVCCLLMWAAVAALGRFAAAAGLPLGMVFLLQVLLGVVVYSGSLWLFFRPSLSAWYGVLRKR